MYFEDLIDRVTAFAQANPLIATIAGIVLVFAIYRRPKFFLIMLFFTLLLAGAFYFIMSLSSAGVAKKKNLLREDRGIEDIIPSPLNITLSEKGHVFLGRIPNAASGPSETIRYTC